MHLYFIYFVITLSFVGADYSVNLIYLPADPILSYLDNTTSFPQSFNPSFVEASPGTNGVRGLLVRSQNCSFTPGQCISCNGLNPFRGSVISFAKQRDDGSFEKPYLVFAPSTPSEDMGTEDPRIKYDPISGLYHLFYTCYSSGPDGGLCHAVTTDPSTPFPGKWVRYGTMWKGKSAALLLMPAPPHYLYQGDSNINLWKTTDLFNYTLLNSSFIVPRPDKFDSFLVEAGPPPLFLSDGNIIFFHNSANATMHAYHPGFVIINGSDPTQILQRSETPILSPTRDWEIGSYPAECNVANVVFLEAAAPVDGMIDTYDVWFGGSDAVVGTARFRVSKS
jgi:predicted GH43/DUF377 family glycosyl hydrolase